jgi:hypothetical protein
MYDNKIYILIHIEKYKARDYRLEPFTNNIFAEKEC